MNRQDTKSKIGHVIALGALLIATPDVTMAQDRYPSRPVKIIMPFAAGGITDILARVVAERLQAKWSQPFVVESRPGASGNIGAEVVARSEPNGYTLLAAPPPPLAINQNLFAKLGFDPSAFVPVTVIATAPNVLIVHPRVPVSNVMDLIAFAKANPDKLSYASTGSGGTPHLTAEMLKAEAGVRIVHVPYKGVPPAFHDLMGGQVDMMFANLADSLQHIRSGKFKAIGVASRQRLPGLPDVAAVSETLPEFVSETWFAIVAPPRTPPEIASKLSAGIAETLRLPDVTNKLRDLLLTPMGSSPAESAAFIKQDAERWRKVIVAAGIKPE
jgi:tripartite-type tricarboxylate transporter receptor subunit TctC